MNSFDVCCRNPLLSSSGQHILLLKEELDCRWWKMMSLTRKECHGKMALLSCQDQLDHCMYRSSVIYFTEFHVQSSPDFFLYFTYGHGSFLLVALLSCQDQLDHCYILLVLRMMSYSHMMARNRRYDRGVYYSNWLNRKQQDLTA